MLLIRKVATSPGGNAESCFKKRHGQSDNVPVAGLLVAGRPMNRPVNISSLISFPGCADRHSHGKQLLHNIFCRQPGEKGFAPAYFNGSGGNKEGPSGGPMVFMAANRFPLLQSIRRLAYPYFPQAGYYGICFSRAVRLSVV